MHFYSVCACTCVCVIQIETGLHVVQAIHRVTVKAAQAWPDPAELLRPAEIRVVWLLAEILFSVSLNHVAALAPRPSSADF